MEYTVEVEYKKGNMFERRGGKGKRKSTVECESRIENLKLEVKVGKQSAKQKWK